jgi:hypothetical protein
MTIIKNISPKEIIIKARIFLFLTASIKYFRGINVSIIKHTDNRITNFLAQSCLFKRNIPDSNKPRVTINCDIVCMSVALFFTRSTINENNIIVEKRSMKIPMRITPINFLLLFFAIIIMYIKTVKPT